MKLHSFSFLIRIKCGQEMNNGRHIFKLLFVEERKKWRKQTGSFIQSEVTATFKICAYFNLMIDSNRRHLNINTIFPLKDKKLEWKEKEPNKHTFINDYWLRKCNKRWNHIVNNVIFCTKQPLNKYSLNFISLGVFKLWCHWVQCSCCQGISFLMTKEII